MDAPVPSFDLNLASNLPYLLAQASALASLQIDALAKSVGMTRNETKTILSLISDTGRRQGHTLNELAEIMMVKQPTLSRVVEGMVKNGLLKRQTAAADRRTVNITLTHKGQEQATILADHARAVEHRFQDKLGPQEFKTLVSLLNLVVTRLK